MPEREGMPSRVEEVLSLLASQSKIPCALDCRLDSQICVKGSLTMPRARIART